MKKIEITKKVYDTVEKVTLSPKDIVEREAKRADHIIERGFAVEVEAPKLKKKTAKKK